MAVTINGTTGIETNTDTGKVKVGTDDDLQIYHDGSHSYVDNTGTGNLYLKDAGAVKVRTANFGVDNADGSEAMISATADGAVELYHNNSKKLETYVDGVLFDGHGRPGTNNTHDLGTASHRWRNIYTNDLNLSNEGSSNDVDGSWGDWTIQEGESDLFLKNNRSGKKYKFNLTEVS